VRRGAEGGRHDRNVCAFDVLEQKAKPALDRQRLIYPLCETGDLPVTIDLFGDPLEQVMLLQSCQIISHIAVGHTSLPCGT
jgi:hypothetical protein